MTEIQGKLILVRVSARFKLARVRVIRTNCICVVACCHLKHSVYWLKFYDSDWKKFGILDRLSLMEGGHFWEVITYGGSTVNTHLENWKYDAAIKIWKI